MGQQWARGGEGSIGNCCGACARVRSAVASPPLPRTPHFYARWLLRIAVTVAVAVAVDESPSHARTHEAANMAASLTAAAPPPLAAAGASALALSLAVLTTSVICCKLQTATISQRTPPPHSNGAKQHGRQLWPRVVRQRGGRPGGSREQRAATSNGWWSNLFQYKRT